MQSIPHTKLPVRQPTKAKYDAFRKTTRIPLVDIVDIAIDALNSMPRETRDALIERRPPRVRRPSRARAD